MKTSNVVAIGLTSLAVASVALMPKGRPEKDPTPSEEARVVSCKSGPLLVCDAYELKARDPNRYRRVEVASEECAHEKTSDTGVTVELVEFRPIRPRAGLEVVPGSCAPASGVVGTRVRDGGTFFLAMACACRKAAGTCEVRNESGMLEPAPFGITLAPGLWVGDGCAGKACVELSGASSWPSVCPGG